jgi:hypothetical protein
VEGKVRKPWKQRYLEHIKSARWADLKQKVIKRRGHQCERCANTQCALDLHHEHYRTFGRERQKDVRLLCRPCHRIEDSLRKKRGDADRAWIRLCGEYGGNVSDADMQLLEDMGYIKSTPTPAAERIL